MAAESFGTLLTVAAASSAITEATRGLYVSVAKPWLDDYSKRHHPVAAAKAEANTLGFLVELVQRIERLEAGTSSDEHARHLVETALQDPDVAETIRVAVLGAARTSDPRRHEVLAQAVTERLRADQGSVRAVASTLAVEAIPRLATEHLDMLGLMAVIYGIRATWLLPDESGVTNESWPALDVIAHAKAAEYADWLGLQLTPYAALGDPSPDTFGHLVAAGCITYDLKVRRKLITVLTPARQYDEQRARPSDFALPLAIQSVAPVWYGGWLERHWATLQRARPTPAGMLIGCAVHDAKLGGGTATEWQWAAPASSDDHTVADEIWDGEREINQKFLEQLEKEFESRVERGIFAWRNILKR